MKILIVAPRFHTNLYYRALSLQEAGHELKVFTLYKGKSEFYRNIDFSVFKLSAFSKFALGLIKIFKKTYLKSGLELRLQAPDKNFRQEIKEFNPDVILLKSYQELLAIKTLRIAKKNGAKVLMLTQTDKTHIKGSKFLFGLNIKYFATRVHAYVTPIKSNYDAFQKFGIKNTFYLPFVYPLQPFEEKKISSEIKIISIGKYEKRKDQILSIKATEKLLQKYNIKINFYGEVADLQYFEFLKKYVEKNELSQNVELHTNISYDKICEKYKENHIFVLPSYAEPAAYSIVEAMAHGLPVVCSSENGTKSYIMQGENGYVFEAKNAENLEILLAKTIENYTEMAKNAWQTAKNKHQPQKFAEQIEKIVNEKHRNIK